MSDIPFNCGDINGQTMHLVPIWHQIDANWKIQAFISLKLNELGQTFSARWYTYYCSLERIKKFQSRCHVWGASLPQTWLEKGSNSKSATPPKIFEPYFLKNWTSKFFKIFRECRAPCLLSTKEVTRNPILEKISERHFVKFMVQSTEKFGLSYLKI